MKTLELIKQVYERCRGQGATTFLVDSAPIGSVILVGNRVLAADLRGRLAAKDRNGVTVVSIDASDWLRGVLPGPLLIDSSVLPVFLAGTTAFDPEKTLTVSGFGPGVFDSVTARRLCECLMQAQEEGVRIIVKP